MNTNIFDIVFTTYGSDDFDVNRKYEDVETLPINKPKNNSCLFASAEDHWCQWCEENDYNMESLDKCFKFKLRSDANVLVITKNIFPYLFYINIDLGKIKVRCIDYEKLFNHFGVDAIYVPQEIIDNREEIKALHNLDFGFFDVDTLMVRNLDCIEIVK